DFNLVAGPEIFLDRRSQPWRGDIELDRAAGQAPPKREQREEDETAERAADNCEFAQPRIPRAQPHSPFVHAGCRAGATDLAIVLRRGLMPAQLVLEACLQLQESLETGIRLSSRHARLGVPSTTDSARVMADVCGEPAPLPRSTKSPALQ